MPRLFQLKDEFRFAKLKNAKIWSSTPVTRKWILRYVVETNGKVVEEKCAKFIHKNQVGHEFSTAQTQSALNNLLKH